MATKSKFTVKHGLAVHTQSGTTALLNYPAADGTNNQFIKTDGSGNLSFDSSVSSFINLTDTPANFDSAASRFLRVDSTGTAVEFSDVTVTNNVSRESFTASGDSNVITLANTYVGDNYVLVFIDGVIQFPGTNFSLDSTVLTFTATPDSAARIEVFGTSGNIITVPGDTTVSAAKLTNPLALPDNHKITFGTGSDLQIYHDGGNNIISGTINNIVADSLEVNGNILSKGHITVEDSAYITGNLVAGGHITSNGNMVSKGTITSSGHILPSADSTYDLGSATYKWRSLYVGGSSIYLGNKVLRVDSDGIVIPSGSRIGNRRFRGAQKDFDSNLAGTYAGKLLEFKIDSGGLIDSIGNFTLAGSSIDTITFPDSTGTALLSATGKPVHIKGTVFVDQSGGTVTLDANGHITGYQKLNAITAGGRITGKTFQGDMARIDLSQAKAGTNGGYLSFQTANTSGTLTEAMRIDSAGNVGIGMLPVALTGNHFVNSLSIASNGPYIVMKDENNANKMRYIANNGGAFQFGTVNDDGSTSKTEHMRIDSHGMVGIGNYSSAGPVDRFEVKGDSASYVAKIGGPEVYSRHYASGSNNQIAVYADGDTPGSKNHIYSMGIGGYDKIKISGTTTTAHVWIANGLNVGDLTNTAADNEIRATGNITAYFGSDKRLKENIKPLENAIDKIKSIRGVEFDWTDEDIERRGGEDGYFVQKHDVGVIAQEIEEVLPEVVRDRDDGFKAVQYEKMVPLLIQAIKEQQNQIDELKDKLNGLTG